MSRSEGEKLPAAANEHVIVVAPSPPPYGGMALQAVLLVRLLKESGISAELLGYNEPFRRLRFLERIRGCRNIARIFALCGRIWVKTTKPSVVHVLACSWFYFFSVVVPAVLVGKFRGRRVVLNYRGGDAEVFFDKYGWLARPIFRFADIVTVPSTFLAEIIQRKLCTNAEVVSNIVDLGHFSFRKRTTFEPRLLVTRQLTHLYGIDTILDAFRLIVQRLPEASLMIAGSGPQEKELKKRAFALGLPNVHFLGAVGTADLPALYSDCDILLNGSRVDNFPGSLMEGAASGLAIVSTDSGGIPTLFEDGKSALLVRIDDHESMARAVERIASDPQLGMQLAAQARRIAQSCDWPAVSAALFASYGWSRQSAAFTTRVEQLEQV